MKTVFIEVEHPFNWGKFMVAQYEQEEFNRLSAHPDASTRSLVCQRGWDKGHVWVMDLETGEGACFRHGGLAEADLKKHQIWVCPMFVHFLKWLYKQDLSDLDKLPKLIKLTYEDAEGAMYCPRYPGPGEK